MVRASVSYVPDYPFEGVLHFANGAVGVYKGDPAYTLDITGAVNSDEVRIKGVSLLDTNDKVPAALLPAASLSDPGIVQLSDSFGSFDSTVAASSRAVRGLRDTLLSTVWGTTQIPALDASKVTTGVFDAARIPGLDSSKVTTGVFDAARIPDLDAGKVTAGTFATSQIPGLDASKITTGTLATARLPTASTAGAGIVQLSDAINSSSVSTAATSNSVKQVADNLQALINNPLPVTANTVQKVDGTATNLTVTGYFKAGKQLTLAYTNPSSGSIMRYCIAKLEGQGQFLRLNGAFTSTIGDWFASYAVEVYTGLLPASRHMVSEATVIKDAPPDEVTGGRIRVYYRVATGELEVVLEVPAGGHFNGTLSAEATALTPYPAAGAATLPLVVDAVSYYGVFDAYYNASVVKEMDPLNTVAGKDTYVDPAKGKPAVTVATPLTLGSDVHITAPLTLDGELTANGAVAVTGDAEVTGDATITGKVTAGSATVTGDVAVTGYIGIGAYATPHKLFVNGSTCINGPLYKWRGDMLIPVPVIDSNGNISWDRIVDRPDIPSNKMALAGMGLGGLGLLFTTGALFYAGVGRVKAPTRGAGTNAPPPNFDPANTHDNALATEADPDSGAPRAGPAAVSMTNTGSSMRGHSGNAPRKPVDRNFGQRTGRNFLNIPT